MSDKCPECNTDLVAVECDVFLYRGMHERPAPQTGMCSYEVKLGMRPTTAAEAKLAVCPGCGERDAMFNFGGTSRVPRKACPNGCLSLVRPIK